MAATNSIDTQQGPVMTKLMVHLQTAITERDDRGAAMAEYGLLLAFVALAAMSVLFVFGNSLKTTFGLATDTLANSDALSGSTGSTSTSTTN